MSITKTEILNDVKARLSRGELASIDVELKTVLMELSSRVPGMVEKTADVTVGAAALSGALPADYLLRRSLTNSTGLPLQWVDSIEELLNYYSTGTASGSPQRWTVFEKKAYVWPKPAAETSLKLYYHYEESNVAAIGLPDVAREALIEGVCCLVELGKGLQGQIPPEAVTHSQWYEKQVSILQSRYGAKPIEEGKDTK